MGVFILNARHTSNLFLSVNGAELAQVNISLPSHPLKATELQRCGKSTYYRIKLQAQCNKKQRENKKTQHRKLHSTYRQLASQLSNMLANFTRVEVLPPNPPQLRHLVCYSPTTRGVR
jgi:hypothetical protein